MTIQQDSLVTFCDTFLTEHRIVVVQNAAMKMVIRQTNVCLSGTMRKPNNQLQDK